MSISNGSFRRRLRRCLSSEFCREVHQPGLGAHFVVRLGERLFAAEPLAHLVEESMIEHVTVLLTGHEYVRVDRLETVLRPRPVLHFPAVLLSVPHATFPHRARHSVDSNVNEDTVVLAGKVVTPGAHKTSSVTTVIHPGGEDEEGVDTEPVVEALDALRHAVQRNDAFLHSVGVHRCMPDHGSLSDLEEGDLRGTHPAPQRAVEGVVGEWNHVLHLPENGAGEALVVVVHGDVLLVHNLRPTRIPTRIRPPNARGAPGGVAREEGLDPPEVERLPPPVNRVHVRPGRNGVGEATQLHHCSLLGVGCRLYEVRLRLVAVIGVRLLLQYPLQLCGGTGGDVGHMNVGRKLPDANGHRSAEPQATHRPRQGPKQVGVLGG
eukprot:Hpha_TRINITY_DN16980_c2_g3::TRINITY_DN16980_c2_g3_i1::g.54320::m.54320